MQARTGRWPPSLWARWLVDFWSAPQCIVFGQTAQNSIREIKGFGVGREGLIGRSKSPTLISSGATPTSSEDFGAVCKRWRGVVEDSVAALIGRQNPVWRYFWFDQRKNRIGGKDFRTVKFQEAKKEEPGVIPVRLVVDKEDRREEARRLFLRRFCFIFLERNPAISAAKSQD
ncbi:hypothetical protein U1Q18_019596 [Sarracenia purpurea var. burkii]